MKIGFFVNPLAGYGGEINNKGSDNLKLESIEKSYSLGVARKFLSKIIPGDSLFYVPYGYMGSYLLDEFSYKYEITYYPEYPSSSQDTVNFIKSLVNPDFVCFVGGDGTARDIVSCGTGFLFIGIPAGVKMYSSVFSINAEHAASLFNSLVSSKNYETTYAEVNDINEEDYRNGRLSIKNYGLMKIIKSGDVVINSKAEYSQGSAGDIAEYIIDNMDNNTYYLIGPGTTCKEILLNLGIKTNILGFDLILNKSLVASDIDEPTIYHYVSQKRTVMIISPIGGQGFLLGRGNKQISGRVFDLIGFDNIIIVSTEEKLNDIKDLYIDINTSKKLPEYVRILTGYGYFKIKRLVH
ncbi:hypothetical protein SE19_07775 [Acidiplasma aeolicum]|uniref:ATP-NAD kinase n=3 Tax=Acidiplasma TaxID=507753 RepID=A0A0Q0RIX1_9ARCH|nr:MULTISPECIES: ATP-NAD kinase family protein [Acidiplasma]KPV45925.1 hypothetical protein SE19_07775 [Acidiplasma aeolicum]KQB35383.1 hypothetical protein AOG55_06945 [Acidiplasma cupricumulans]KQB35743.1 hypothetical protein AOG54_02735 [Acidiplasma aeolicum]